jgi:hypothetical protein
MIIGILALLALIAMTPFYFAAGLMAPAWAVAVFILVWLGLFAAGVLLLVRRRPLWVIPLPVAAALFWIGGMTLGDLLLGWTA